MKVYTWKEIEEAVSDTTCAFVEIRVMWCRLQKMNKVETVAHLRKEGYGWWDIYEDGGVGTDTDFDTSSEDQWEEGDEFVFRYDDEGAPVEWRNRKEYTREMILKHRKEAGK